MSLLCMSLLWLLCGGGTTGVGVSEGDYTPSLEVHAPKSNYLHRTSTQTIIYCLQLHRLTALTDYRVRGCSTH